jgi:AcrR family transcriptional regulator
MSAETQSIHPRKLEIVEAAVTCSLEKGYHQTGVRDIVGQAGISLGNLYNHFKGKEAILVFIAKIEGQELSDFIDRLSDNDDPRATLGWFITDYAAYVSLPENALLGAEILTESLRNPAIGSCLGVGGNLKVA